MRVFVLCTERSGSTTFARACGHITNYTSAHETNQNSLDRHVSMYYDDNHIEIDNRLAFNLGYLGLNYSNAFYVHLQRNRHKVVDSLMKRFHSRGSIVDIYTDGIIGVRPEKLTLEEKRTAADLYVRTVNNNIREFLRNKTSMVVGMDPYIKRNFNIFWDKIGAEGDIHAALAEFDVRHNNSDNKKYRYLLHWEIKLLLLRLWNKFKFNHNL